MRRLAGLLLANGLLATQQACSSSDQLTTPTPTPIPTPTPTLTSYAADVTVALGQPLATLPALGFGVATAVYDNNLVDLAVAGRLQAAGIKAVRFPGGSYADIYHWQTHRATTGASAYLNANDTFDNLMTQVVNPAGARALITCNYGSNPAGTDGADPSECADWVRYANVTHNYGIRYWEIGNEQGGNGYYGSQWEEDLHADKSPMAYGRNAVAFTRAMKAVDPSIKVGVGICIPGDWPDNMNPPYNASVLAECGSVIDFVIVHWYPGGTAAALLQKPSTIPVIVQSIRNMLTQNLGARASQVEIAITETGGGDVQAAPVSLFAADDFLSWLENGIVNVDWQELHNQFLTAADSGMADDEPEAPYYGAQMAHLMADVGDTFVTATSSASQLRVHAARRANGSIGLTLINTDAHSNCTAAVNVPGAGLAAGGTRFDFGQANYGTTNYPVSGPVRSDFSASGASFTITVPAYSMTTLVIPIAGQ